jgi:hypothetical protein
MMALQQRVHVALSLGLLKATLACDLGDEVVVPFSTPKDLIHLTPLRALHFEPISLSTIFLENILPGLGSHSGFPAAVQNVVLSL